MNNPTLILSAHVAKGTIFIKNWVQDRNLTMGGQIVFWTVLVDFKRPREERAQEVDLPSFELATN